MISDIQFYFSEKLPYPLIIEPTQKLRIDLSPWMKAHEGWINNKLNESGAILFRGFELPDAKHFQRIVQIYGDKSIEYKERTSPRSKVLENIYTSTNYPSDLTINMHNESSYSSNWPKKLMFFCNIPPDVDGETPLADSRRVLSMLDKDIKNEFLSKGVMYKRTFGTGMGLNWEEAFQTNNKRDVEVICKQNNTLYQWDNDLLRLTWVRPAVLSHPDTGEQVWFNHAFFYHPTIAYEKDFLEVMSEDELPFCSYYGDGKEIEEATVQHIKEIYDKISVRFSWQMGDLLLVDNLLIAHGRSPYKGPRQILVALF